MFGIFKRILIDKKTSLIAYSLGSMAVVEMYIALFPAIRDQAQELNKLLEAYPKGLMEAFGFSSTEALFSRVESYMSTEYFSVFWPIMAITMMIGFANAMMVAEIEKGTIELTLSQPVSRLKVFFSRYLAGMTYFAVFNFISVFAIVLFSKLHGIEYQADHYLTTMGISYLFGLTVFAMAALFSAMFSEKGKAMALSAAILLSMYIVNIVSSLKDSLENLKYASIFYYFNPSMVLGNNEVVKYSIPVFLATTILLTAAAALRFVKRDVAS